MSNANNWLKMPEHHLNDDVKWIQEMLSQLPVYVRQRAIEGYSDVFLQAMDEEQISYKKENAACKAANIRLREFVEKFKPVTTEKVSKPPIAKAA
ncbi:hypothetical protein [Limnobaculum xujianqingii]|nr:hypothetical protein [Limnobaculum xujianqingii]